jgi:CRISPR-associated protein Cas10/Cmr2 subtype III-B
MNHDTQGYWKSKLAAFLHDPPSKCVDLRLHEIAAKTLYRQAGFLDDSEITRLSDAYAKTSDWTASAADRYPFPKSRGNLASAFDGVRAQFRHPLSAGHLFPFHSEFASAEAAMEVDSTVQPAPQEIDAWPDEEKWQARFFCHWRLWEKFCTEKDYRFAFLPADTRIPDHSVWTHMQVVSALESCADGTGANAVLKPAFLKFQIGPVQEFIAEARNIRDLWSGSYMLSWLMAVGMKALALEVGPDAVIFPNLKGQPIFDLHLRDCLWSRISVNGKTIWEHLNPDPKDLLTPNLPNVFLAVVHQDRAAELGALVENAILDEWVKIATHVWEFLENETMIPDEEAGFTAVARKARFDAQVARFLSISWQSTPWPDSLDDALALAKQFEDQEMPTPKAAERVAAIVDYVTQTMPEVDRDSRYYSDDAKTRLNNIGLGWSVILAYNGWQLDAVRQTRAFSAWNSGGWESGSFSNKDSLGGKAEAVAGGKAWQDTAAQRPALKSLFKHDDWLAASTLIKRVWHLAYLKNQMGLATDPQAFPMPNTRGIAIGEPFSSDEDENVETLPGEKYFAVLALDGDEIGKWVSGEKTPTLGSQFSDYTDANNAQRQGARVYFENHQGTELLATHRPLSPAYHIQFSQALSNFALLATRIIVEAHKGRLIYAGGDDVLALLPADTALACATSLRQAFRGEDPSVAGIRSTSPGYLSISNDQLGQPISFIVPGPAAEVSVGIAVAHFKSPLQDAIRTAQQAEKRAKNQLGRAAVALTVIKRSGEITEWGTKWQSGGLELFAKIAELLASDSLSDKFPHRVCQLVNPYIQPNGSQVDDTADFRADDIIRQEFGFAITRQSATGKATSNRETLMPLLAKYLTQIESSQTDSTPSLAQAQLTAMTGLCTAVAFAHRTR